MHHLIVKQSTLESRSKGSFTLDLNRYKLEYDAMKICAAIVPDLIPKLYDCDEENRVFITEDVSYLRISRFQLLKGVTYPKLADQIARYMAATQFYTSEYYSFHEYNYAKDYGSWYVPHKCYTRRYGWTTS